MTPFGPSAPPALPPRPRLAFAEGPAQAAWALAHWASARFDGCVALDPAAAWTLWRAGRPYLKLEDTASPAHVFELAEKALDEQVRWAASVDDFLGERVPAFAQTGFRPAAAHLYWLKFIFDAFLVRTEAVTSSLRAWSPSQVFFAAPCVRGSGGDEGVLFAESLYPRVLSAASLKFGVVCETFPPPAEAPAAGTRLEMLRRRLAVLAEVPSIPLGPALRRRLERIGLRREKDVTPRAGNLVIDPRYDLREVWEEAARRGLPVDSWSAVVAAVQSRAAARRDTETARRVLDLWDEASREEDFRRPLRPQGCDFWSVAEGKLRHWWRRVVPEQWDVFREARGWFADARPRAVAVPNPGDHRARGVFQALKTLGVPAFVYQHGGFVGPCVCPPWDVTDLREADVELTYGPGTTRYFEGRRAGRGIARARCVSVGSARLDAFRRKRPGGTAAVPARPRVLLVPNVIQGRERYLDCGSAPDVTEAEIQAAMVSLAREFPRFDFVYKVFYAQVDTPAVALARGRGANCRLVYKTPLPRLMERADLIVFNFPSTAMLEALTGDRPLFVLVDRRHVRMSPEALASLRRRARVGESARDFFADLRIFLARGDFSRLADPDRSFLRDYATHLDDGRSAARALEAMERAGAVAAGGR